MDSAHPIEITAAFNTSAQQSSVMPINADNAVSVGGPVYAYYGHLAITLNLPVGVKDNLAYTAFQASGTLPGNSTLSAQVDVMLPQLIARWSSLPPS